MQLSFFEMVVTGVMALLLLLAVVGVVLLFRNKTAVYSPPDEVEGTRKPTREPKPSAGVFSRFGAWISKNNELLLIPGAAALWWVHPHFLRIMDPTAAPMDSGILSALFFALTAFFLFKGVVFWALIQMWPTVNDFFNNQFDKTWNDMKPHQRMAAALVLLFVPLSLLVLLTMAAA